MSKSIKLGAFTAVLALSLSACSEVEPANEGSDVLAADNLADVLADSGRLTMVADALDETGIGTIFEGPASYTIFAPVDEAFEGLGGDENVLTSEAAQPIMTAILRDHMAAGHLTTEALKAAIAQSGGTVELKTLGDSILTVTEMDGEMVIESDGIQARVASDEAAAKNGVVIPIDRVLVNAQAD